MKKLIISIAIISSALLLSYLFVNKTLFANPFNQSLNSPVYARYQQAWTYETLYMHLYDINKDQMDQSFVEALKDSSIDQLELDEALVELDLIKVALVLEYAQLFETTFRHGGMMGRNNYNGCHSNIDGDSYEFYYVHQTNQMKQYMDEQFLTLLAVNDLSALSVEDMVLLVHQIKTDILFDLTNN